MARTTATNFSGGLQFPYATAGTDIFKKEDVQTLAQAVDQHDHTTGKGVAVNTTPANASITNAKLGPDVARDNLLTNGGFEIWQRGNGPFAIDGYIADRWLIYRPVGTISVTRDTANTDVPSGACAAVVSTGASAGNNQQIYQYPATAGDNNMSAQLRGRVVTFSVRVRASVANAVRLALNSGSLVNGAYHSGGGAYETLTVSATMPSNLAGIGVTCSVSIEAAGTFYIDNAMLVVGSQAADYAPLHPADDLARCLRYYEKVKAAVRINATGNQSNWTPVPYKTSMAVTPTLTLGTADFTANLQAGSPSFAAPTADGCIFLITSNATGDAYWAGPVALEGNP